MSRFKQQKGLLPVSTQRPHRITFANEKGGTGKSTTAVHVAVALAYRGACVAALDLDPRQRTMHRYFENRGETAARRGIALPGAQCEVFRGESLADLDAQIARLGAEADFLVVDTPGRDDPFARHAAVEADTLVTPLNDSFVDFDLIGQVDAETFKVRRLSFYAELIWETRKRRALERRQEIDWVVVRNRTGPRMEPVVDHADAQKQRARDEPVAEHDDHRAFQPLHVEREQADGHNRHVRDRGIGDQLLHVVLHQRDQASDDHGDHAEREDEPGELRACLGEHRQAEADEAVAAHLEQHARQDHRACRGRLHVRVWQPCMHRPHRHLDREAGEEREPQPGLRFGREIVLHQRRDVGRPRLVHHPQHRDQHQHRAQQRVEEELVAGVDTVRPAPDADDEIHRDQAGLEHDVEQEQVLRREHADHQRFHEQERGHVFAHALVDRLPACEDADRHQEHAEDDQHQRDAVDAQCPLETREQVRPLGELPLRAADVVIGPQQDTEREVRQRRHQRDHACWACLDEHTQRGRDQRHREHRGKDREAPH
ncbi:division plane positioning ATPase MipZ [Leptolyngbya sp. 15MV]|nr:division plane positioning ATPase MipZ [Leptolyngbya sp. 15MV]